MQVTVADTPGADKEYMWVLRSGYKWRHINPELSQASYNHMPNEIFYAEKQPSTSATCISKDTQLGSKMWEAFESNYLHLKGMSHKWRQKRKPDTYTLLKSSRANYNATKM